MVEDAVRDAQPAHVAVLRPARHRTGRGSASGNCPRASGTRRPSASACEPRVGVEGMLGALPFLLLGELAAGRDRPVLRLERGRHRGRSAPPHRTRRVQGSHRRPARPRSPRRSLRGSASARRRTRTSAQAASRLAGSGGCEGRPNMRSLRKDETGSPERMRSQYQSPSATSPTRTAPTRRPSRIMSLR